MAFRGRGVAQQNRGSSGEGIWIIVQPIAGNYPMASRGAKVTLCEVAMLSICSEDMLAYIRLLRGRGVCAWLQEEAGFSAARH